MRYLILAFGLLVAALALPPPGLCLEVTSEIYRFRGHEMSTGYYEQYEVRPMRNRAFVESPRPGRTGGILSGPMISAETSRRWLADSHAGLRFYLGLACTVCHAQDARNTHSARNGITCRQCHGGEPISSAEFYYSPLNRMRRHAYICAKCHQGASYSFATYVIHEPNPAMTTTAQSFPALFWGFWIMVGIAVVTFMLFVPHTLLWLTRDLFSRNKEDQP